MKWHRRTVAILLTTTRTGLENARLMPGSVRRFAFALAVTASFAVPASASAAEFSLGGYYRMRLELFKSLSANVGLENTPNGATTGYWQHRVRLDPKVKLNDNVAFYAQVDLLDNVIAGDNPEIDTAYGNALAEFFSQAVVPQNDSDSNDAGACTATPEARTSATSAERSARSSTIEANARSPSSYAEKLTSAPPSPSTRIDSTAVTRSGGSACHAPSARRNVVLPGLIA